MKYVLLIGYLFMMTAGVSAQEMQVDTAGFQTFSYQEGDTTYLMKKYYLCLLKKGPRRDQTGEQAELIQQAHLEHLAKLAADRKICMAGPFEDDSDILGILIFSTPTLEEAQQLADSDPAVQVGRLIAEIHPWWAAIGSQLF